MTETRAKQYSNCFFSWLWDLKTLMWRHRKSPSNLNKNKKVSGVWSLLWHVQHDKRVTPGPRPRLENRHCASVTGTNYGTLWHHHESTNQSWGRAAEGSAFGTVRGNRQDTNWRLKQRLCRIWRRRLEASAANHRHKHEKEKEKASIILFSSKFMAFWSKKLPKLPIFSTTKSNSIVLFCD